jgi:hypothetical protein
MHDMLKVTIELFPYGDETRAREISSFFIGNDGTGDIETGNYIYKKRPEDEWQPSVQKWLRRNPVEQLVRAVIEKHYD